MSFQSQKSFVNLRNTNEDEMKPERFENPHNQHFELQQICKDIVKTIHMNLVVFVWTDTIALYDKEI